MEADSKWIWAESEPQYDSYAEFVDTFEISGNSARLFISADSNYTVYVNGLFVDSGQYPDFPYYKVYDKIDITRYCVQGKNTLAVIVWYYGQKNMSYFPGKAALRFELYDGKQLVCCSGDKTQSRLSLSYKNGYKKVITGQLGYSFLYDSTKEDDWKTGSLHGFADSVMVQQNLPMFERPIHKLKIAEKCETTVLKNEDNKHFLIDIGREEVGYLTIKVRSKISQKLTIAYGEHIVDGCVRRIIGTRDFSTEIVIKSGVTEYTNYFRRLGLRYLEIFAEQEIELDYASVLPCFYPLKKITKSFGDDLTDRIYDVSVRTLELCMHDHYEDCPWREQALYAMDSRNQMLCGYYAFNEYCFPRANLYLMSKDDRADGLLSICTPSGENLTIPSFSLHYYLEVYEYTKYSGDLTLIRQIMPKLCSVLDTFLNHMENGLIPNFAEKCHWNFYEWSDDLSGKLHKEDNKSLEAALNCMLSLALDRMDKICEILGQKSNYKTIADKLNDKILEVFYDSERQLFVNRAGEHKYSELVNSLAILCGAAKGETAAKIAQIMAGENELTNATLSMVCFKYDALLMINKDKYKDYVLNDIRVKYKKMLDLGATSFWETEKGEADFSNAGSLCHGWSAMPVYYFSTLL